MPCGVVWTGLTMALATLATIDLYLPGGLIAGVSSEEGDLATARTAGFTVLVLAQLFNCFNARSETASAFRNLFVNRWLWGAIALSALLQVAVVHFPPLNLVFGTAPLSLQQWAGSFAMLKVRVVRTVSVETDAALSHLSAASGLVQVGQRLFVVADDEPTLGVFDATGEHPGRLHRLFGGELPDKPKARKAAKPDRGAGPSAALAGFPQGALAAIH